MESSDKSSNCQKKILKRNKHSEIESHENIQTRTVKDISGKIENWKRWSVLSTSGASRKMTSTINTFILTKVSLKRTKIAIKLYT